MTINNIKKLRSEKNISQAELAKKIGVTQQQLSSYETGKNNPRIETAKKLSECLEVSLDEIFLDKNTINNCIK